MTKTKWLFVIIPLFLTWGIDRVTKIWATGLTTLTWHGPIGTMLHHNHGAILGLFADMPAILRTVSLSTGGAFLFFLFFIIQYLLPTPSMYIRTGLSFLLGGILGNVADRIIWGYVVDFILIGTERHFSPAFNLADALQWVGYVLVVTGLIKDGKSLWPVENARKSYWINIRFQLKYCLTLMALSLCLSIIAGTFSYSYLKVTIHELRGPDAYLTRQILGPYIFTFSIVSLTSALCLFLVGLILSHRAAGPLYAFERFLNDFIAGKKSRLKLRAGDEFTHLEKLANKLSDTVTLVHREAESDPNPGPDSKTSTDKENVKEPQKENKHKTKKSP